MKWFPDRLHLRQCKHTAGRKAVIVLKNVPMGKIQPGANIGRGHREFIRELGDDFVQAMDKEDAEFPMPVVHELPNGRYGIMDGEHRYYGAKKNKFAVMDVIKVITDDPGVISTLSRVLNNSNGVRPSHDARIDSAMAELLEKGNSESLPEIKKVAGSFTVRLGTLRAMLQMKAMRKEALAAGVPPVAVGRIGSKCWGIIKKTTGLAPVFAKLVQLVAAYSLTDKKAEVIVRMLEGKKTQEAKLALLDEHRARYKEVKKPTPKPPKSKGKKGKKGSTKRDTSPQPHPSNMGGAEKLDFFLTQADEFASRVESAAVKSFGEVAKTTTKRRLLASAIVKVKRAMQPWSGETRVCQPPCDPGSK